MEVNKTLETKTKDGLYCILFSLMLGVIFDRLLIDKALGISYFIFIGLSIGFFLWAVRDRITPRKSFGWFLLIPTALLALSFAVHTVDIFNVLNFLAVPILMIASSILIVNPSVKWDKASFITVMLRRGIVNVVSNIMRPFKILKASIKIERAVQMKEGKKQILIGILVSLPLLVILILLLSSADMVFGYYFANLTEIFTNINVEDFLPHTIVILIIAFYLFGYIWSFRSEEKAIEKDHSVPAVSWEAVTIITVLVALNILYLIFTMIQFSYLYGGNNVALPANLTYAEYARKGFFELAAVTFINFIIVLNCSKYIKKDNKRLLKIANLLLTVLVAFTLNMLFSANFKLTLYEAAFGYTFLRVSVHLFMLLLFILCLVVATGIWYRKIPIMKSIIVITIIMYTIINFINIDGFIARKNIERYTETGKLDAYYLTSLSFEAIPYLIELRDKEGSSIKVVIDENLKYRKEVLHKENSWAEFNFSKNRARKLLNQGS
jgi:preprotein translocase subunit SecG